MRIESTLFLTAYLFLFIYLPPLLNVNILHVLTIFTLVMISIKDHKEFLTIYKKSGLLSFSYTLVIAIMYLVLVLWFNNGQFITLYGYLVILIETVICSLYVILYCRRKQFEFYELLNPLLLAGLAQAIIATIAFLSPQIQQKIIEFMISNGYSDFLFTMSGHRVYGFSTALTYTTPIVQAILAVITVIMFLEVRKSYILYTPLLFFSAVINSRTSIVIFGVGIICVVLSYIKRENRRKMIILIMGLFLILFAIINIMPFIKSISPNTYIWIDTGLQEINMFFLGERTGYFNTLFNSSFLRLPDGLGLIFGTGETVFGIGRGMSSDVGFINDIWLGGIIFSSIIYLACIRLFIKPLSRQKIINSLSIFIICAFVIANVKGIVINPNELIQLSILCSGAMSVLTTNVPKKRKYVLKL